MKVIQIASYKCQRCGHSWVPRRNRRPAVCPICKRRDWDKPKAKTEREYRAGRFYSGD